MKKRTKKCDQYEELIFCSVNLMLWCSHCRRRHATYNSLRSTTVGGREGVERTKLLRLAHLLSPISYFSFAASLVMKLKPEKKKLRPVRESKP